MNLVKHRLKTSRVPNVSDPSFSDEEVLQIIRDAGYGVFIDEYKRAPTGTGNDEGFWGFWTRQMSGVGIKNPIIFYNEIYPFVNGGKKWSCIISWKYDTEGNLINEPCVTPFPNLSAANLRNDIVNGIQLSNDYYVIGNFNSYKDAQDAVKNDLKKFENIE